MTGAAQDDDRDAYRRIARFYDAVIEPLNAGVRDVALRLDPPDPQWVLLDVGCGTGTGLERYRPAGCTLVGVDVSPSMLERAQRRLGAAAELHLTTGPGLPFPEAAFDVITASMVLHEVPASHRDELVGEMRRVLKPDGHILITDFRVGPLRGVKGRAVKVAGTAIERFAGHWDGYRSFRKDGGVPPLLERNGLALRREKAVAGGNLGVYIAGA